MDRKKEILSIAYPERYWLVLAIVLMIGTTAPALVLPRFLGQMVDRAGRPQDEGDGEDFATSRSYLEQKCFALFAVAIGGAGFDFLRTYILNMCGERIIKRIRTETFRDFLLADVGFFDEINSSSELTQVLGKDVQTLRQAITRTGSI